MLMDMDLNQRAKSKKMQNTKEKIRELVEATLVIGARRGSGVGELDYDSAKELINQHIDNLTERFSQLLSTETKYRSAVIWFAEQMERKLAKNDHKGGWKNCELQYLSMRLTQERKELYDAIESKDAQRIIDECADVSNFCLMLADKFGKNYGK